MMRALSFAEVQEVRDSFATLVAWSGLPIAPDRISGEQLVASDGPASLLKVEDTVAGPRGALSGVLCYAPSLRRFAIHPSDEAGDRDWRVSLNTIGVMVNPTTLRADGFARECYRYMLATEAGEPFDAPWLDEPVLWPKTINRPDDLAAARKAIGDLRPTETVVFARQLIGTGSFIARMIPGASWRDLDWRNPNGEPSTPVPAVESAIGTVRTWRQFLDDFLEHPVAFMLDADGERADGTTPGLLTPAPIQLLGSKRTGRMDWASGERAEELIADPEGWERVLAALQWISGKELARASLAPQSVRAWRTGRKPSRRNAQTAERVASGRALADAGLKRNRASRCIAPDCPERLSGRQRQFCTRHAAYPGARRKAWREAAGR